MTLSVETPDVKVIGNQGSEKHFKGEDMGLEEQSQDSQSDMKEAEVLDPYGNEEGAEIKYKTMTWWQGAMVMVAENISLGILSLPAVLSEVGLVAGIIALLGLGAFSTYSGYVLWQFRMKYPQCASMGDVGEVLLGRVGRELFGFAYVVYCVFCMASHLLTFTIAMNVITQHGTCTIVYGIVGLILFSILTIPRTLKGVSFLSIISFISILSAVLLTMINLGINPLVGAKMVATANPTFPSAFNSITNIVFAYGGHVAWLSFISEFREPRDYPKALIALQSVDISLYLVAAVVIYCYAGDGVASPALSSNAGVVKKISWGIALPTIVIAGVIFAHVTAKYVYLRLFARTKYLHSRGLVATGTWIGLGIGLWTVAWIIAESIPNFSDLLSIISALFASWFSYGLPGFLWFYINQGRWFANWKKICLSVINFILIILGFVICGAGLYSSGKELHESSGGSVWSCADNSE